MPEEIAEPDVDIAPPDSGATPNMGQHPDVLRRPDFLKPGKAGAQFKDLIKEFHEQALPGKKEPDAPVKQPDPAVKVEPKKEEPPPAPTTPIPPSIKGEAAENFRKIASRAESAEKKAADLEAKLKTLEAAPKPDVAEIEATKKKLADEAKAREEYQGIVERFYVEHDPKFQAAFGGRISAAIEDAKTYAGDKAAELGEILAGPSGKIRDQAVKSMVSEMDDFDRAMVIQAYDRQRVTERERDGELTKARQNYAELQKINSKKAEEQAAAAAANQENLKKGWFDAAEKIEAAGEFDQDKEAPAFRRDWLSKAIKEDYPRTEAIKIPGLAAEAVRLKERVIPGLMAKIAEQEKQLASYQSATPGMGAHRTPANPNGKPQSRHTAGNYLQMTNKMPAKSKFMEQFEQ